MWSSLGRSMSRKGFIGGVKEPVRFSMRTSWKAYKVDTLQSLAQYAMSLLKLQERRNNTNAASRYGHNYRRKVVKDDSLRKKYTSIMRVQELRDSNSFSSLEEASVWSVVAQKKRRALNLRKLFSIFSLSTNRRQRKPQVKTVVVPLMVKPDIVAFVSIRTWNQVMSADATRSIDSGWTTVEKEHD